MSTSPADSSEKNPPVVAVLGTGIMGAAMARSLLRAGLSVRAWNRTREKAEALVADGAYCAESPQDAVAGADVVLTMLNDGPRVLAAMGAASAGLAPGTVGPVGHRRGSRDGRARRLRPAAHPGLRRRPRARHAPARRGGGSCWSWRRGRTAREPYSRPSSTPWAGRTTWVDDGSRAAASRLKLVLNSWVAALTHATGEALTPAKVLGVDPQALLDSVSGGPLDSGHLRAKAQAILGGDYTPSFAVSNALKDSG